MSQQTPTEQTLRAENAELRARLEDAEELLRAIRAGEVDALVVKSAAGPQLFTLQGLDAEQNRLRSEMLAQVSDAVVAVDLEERITFLNAAAERQYGVRASDVLGRKLAEISTRHWPSPEQEAAAWAALRGHGEWHGEYLQRMHDGRELPVDSTLTALRDAQGETIGHLTAIRDITGRKRAEEARRQSHERVLLASEAAQMGFWSWQPDDDRVVWENEYPYLILGVPPSSPPVNAARFAAEFLHPDDLPIFEQAIARTLQAHEPLDFACRVRRPDGETRWAEFTGKTEPAEDGRAPRIIGTMQDITERKRAEEALREKEHFLDRITAVTPDVLYVLDITDYHFKWVSQQAANRMGYSAEEILAMGADFMPRVMHPDDLARMPAHFAELARAENGQTLEIDYRLRRPDGTWRWFGGRKTPFTRDADGGVREIIGTSADITERKRAEEAIARLAAIVESSQDAIVGKDLRGTITSWNQGAETLFGYSAEEIVGQSILRLIPPERREEEADILARVARGEGLRDFETVRRRKDGSTVEVSITVSAIKDAAGTIVGISKVARDITERKRVEEALRQNAALFSTLIAQAPMGTYVVDAQFRVREVNAEAMPVFATVQPLVGRDLGEVMAILWGAEVGRRCAAIFRHTLATGERYVSPPFTEQRHDLGIEQTFEWETQRVTFPDGQRGVVCYFHEVTERARATEALRASEERMRLATEATQVGIWEWNVVTSQIRWDAQMFRIYGIAPTADGFVDYTDWSGAVLPEDLVENEAILQDTLRRCGKSERTFHIRRRDDGECRLVTAVETVRANAQGQAEWVVGTNLDITERKQKEEALYASEERLRLFAGQLEHLVKERTEELMQSQSRLRALATELNLAEHRERKRLADELHDYLAQLLVLCRLNLAQMRRIGLSPKAEEKVRETEEVLSKALLYSRSLMAELSPPILHDHGLTAGLLWLGEQMARRGLTVRVDTGGIGDVRPPNDSAVLLFQSVRELLLNALKYAECTEVVVRMELADGRLRIEVCDDGVGFDLVAADSYSPTAMSSKFGLFSIGERMMSLGGWFELTSSCGKGTTAALVMPLKTADSSELKVLSSGLSDNSALPSNSKLITQHSKLHQQDAKIRVLLVDDHAMVRQGLRSVLDSYADIEVVGEAWDGEEAVAGTDRFHPAIVVMDINMPKMNGIEATAYIKARYPEVIVIGMSVQAGGANEEAMKKAGASMLLTKEAVVDELYRAIHHTLAAQAKSGDLAQR